MFSQLLVAALALAGSSHALAPPTHLSRAAADAQSSLQLDPSQVQPGLAQNGQAVQEAGQVPSLTSTNNFINFCETQNGVALTNGQQLKQGSCNPTIMGRVIATTNLPSAKFQFPPNGGVIAANQDFTVKMAISNLATGSFVNAQTNFFAAPGTVDGSGNAVGHSHVVIEAIPSLTDTKPTDPNTFAFFKGLNAAAVGGVLTADVTGGLAAGTYRLASINTYSNHQPILGSIAQHGSFDDQIYFTVSADAKLVGTNTFTGGAAAAAGAGAAAAAAGGKGAAASSSVVSSASASASVAVKGGAAAAASVKASSTSSAAGKATATPAAGAGAQANLQKFTGSLGGSQAPAITSPKAGEFTVQGNNFTSQQAAQQRSCSIQHNACADAANKAGDITSSGLDQNTCTAQLTACLKA